MRLTNEPHPSAFAGSGHSLGIFSALSECLKVAESSRPVRKLERGSE